ncbi:MAG: alpha/beta hydrolase, partial [Oceanicaulis sp.]
LMEQGVRSAHASAEQFVKSELKRWGLTDRDLVLVGFSQGTMMALHTGLRRPAAPAGILGYSGALAGPERLKDEMTAKPPIMLIHGDQDGVLPLGMTLMAAQGLCAAGHGAEFHISYGVPHSIGPDGLELGAHFIKAATEGRLVDRMV